MTPLARRSGTLLACLLLAACSEPPVTPPPPPEPDAGALPEPLTLAEPAAPAAVSPPVLRPCPPGWREVSGAEGEVVTCEPFESADSSPCAADEARFPGDERCNRIGTACPADGWPQGLPSGATVRYVRAGASGGTGTRSAPFGAIRDALAAAGSGEVIAIAAGTYDEVLFVRTGVTLWGACVAGTHLTSSVPSTTDGVVVAQAAPVAVRNLRMSGRKPALIAVEPGAALEVRDVVIDGAEWTAALVSNQGRLTGSRLVIRRTQPRTGVGDLGRALDASGGATVALDQFAAEENRDLGVAALDAGTVVRLQNAVVRGTRARTHDGGYGRGIGASDGARVELTRVAVDRNQDVGAFADSGATLVLDEVLIRDTLAGQSIPGSGFGLTSSSGTIEAKRTVLLRNRTMAVMGIDEAALSLRDVVVRGTLARGDTGENGNGVSIMGGSRLTGERLALERNRASGLTAETLKGSVKVTDLTVRGTEPQSSDGFEGFGVAAMTGAEMVIERGRLVGNSGAGAIAQDSGTRLSLADVVIVGTRSMADRTGGSAVVAQEGAGVSAKRLVSLDNREIALYATGAGTSLTVEDAVVRGTLGDEKTGEWGRGVQAQLGARVELRRARLERSREFGIAVVSPGTSLLGSDVVVRETLENACFPNPCGAKGGIGALAWHDASLVLDRFLVTGNAAVGVAQSDGGSIDLSNGEVSRQPVGVNLQDSGYDVSRLENGVVYVDNDVKLSADLIPLPKALIE